MKPGPKPRPRTPEELAAKKAAKAEYDRVYRAKNAEKISVAKKAWGQTETKKAYDARYAAEHPQRVNAAKTKYRLKDESKEKYLEWRRKDMAQNRDKYRLRSNVRNSRVRRQTPAWADPVRTKGFYEVAARLGVEVDHVIPLRGKLVSGLHVHTNLQLLPAEANRRKKNKYEVEKCQ